MKDTLFILSSIVCLSSILVYLSICVFRFDVLVYICILSVYNDTYNCRIWLYLKFITWKITQHSTFVFLLLWDLPSFLSEEIFLLISDLSYLFYITFINSFSFSQIIYDPSMCLVFLCYLLFVVTSFWVHLFTYILSMYACWDFVHGCKFSLV